MIVGTANDTKSEPASTSNRMTALTRPTRATCTRSSRGSPRPSNRRAMWSASGRHRSTMRSRCRLNLAESSDKPCQLAEHVRRHPRIQSSAVMTNPGRTADSPERTRSSRRHGDAEYLTLFGAVSVLERLHLIGERTQHVPAEAAGRQDVLGSCRWWTPRPPPRSRVGGPQAPAWSPASAERISRVHASSTASRRSDTASKSRSSKVPMAATTVRTTARFSSCAETRTSTERSPCWCPLLTVLDVGHLTSRQCRPDTTPSGSPANHWRSRLKRRVTRTSAG